MPQRVPRYKAPRVPQYRPYEDRRQNAAARGYCDLDHRRWREAVMIRDAYACVMCGAVSASNHADHISPVIPGTDRCESGLSRYDVNAGQCLCHACHNRKTKRESLGRRN